MRKTHLSFSQLKSFTKFPVQLSNFHFLSTIHPLHTLSCDLFSQRKDPTAFATALTLSANLNSLILGNQIHAQILKLGFSNDIFSQNNLISMYCKCGILNGGLMLFDEMPERNLVSWTSIISGVIRNGEFEIGIVIYLEMMRSGFLPNEFTLGSVLKACANLEVVKLGSSIHSLAFKIGIEDNCFVSSSILYMYAKCTDIKAAEWVFECMNDHDVGCWNAMIGGYALNGYCFQALQLLSLMYRKGVTMDQYTFMSAIKGCSIFGELDFGKQIHGMIIRSEVIFSSSGMNSLIDMYFKIGRKEYGLNLFNNIREKDVISWNTVFSEFAQDGNTQEVMSLFSKMLLTGLKPNHVTFSILFRLCEVLLNRCLGSQLYCLAYHLGFLAETLVTNALIDMFSRCGMLEHAYSVFAGVASKDITTWNEMISGYNLNGCSIGALKLFFNLWELGVEANEFTFCSILGACGGTEHLEIGRQIHGAIIRSGFGFHEFVCSSLINAYARFELVEDAFKIFNEIGRLDLAAWGAMISAFVHGGCNTKALRLLSRLIEAGEKPDEFILGSILNSCANSTAYQQTKCIHLIVIKTGFEKHAYVASAVIDAYAKCGDIGSSRMAFNQSSMDADVILFNTMIMSYALHSLVAEAFEIFEKMKLANLQPSHATFVSVISMCSHLRLVEQGCRLFESISLVYAMVPTAENFGCLIDLFSRNGFLEEAKHVIEEMPFEPWPAVWRSLLSGCRIHGNRELGEWASKRLLLLVPESDAAYVLLSKIYSEETCWEDVAKLRRKMKERGVHKDPGYSWIES